LPPLLGIGSHLGFILDEKQCSVQQGSRNDEILDDMGTEMNLLLISQDKVGTRGS
jgi:hypothetical protein